MNRRFNLALLPLAALLLLVSACSLPAMNKKADAAAKALYSQIHDGEDLSANTALGPELSNPRALRTLAAMRRILPDGEATKVANQGWNFNTTNGVTMAELTHAYTYEGGVVVVVRTVLTRRNGGEWSIVGFHVRRDGADGDTDSSNSAADAGRDMADDAYSNSPNLNDGGDGEDRHGGDQGSSDEDSVARDFDDRDSADQDSSGDDIDKGEAPRRIPGDRT